MEKTNQNALRDFIKRAILPNKDKSLIEKAERWAYCAERESAALKQLVKAKSKLTKAYKNLAKRLERECKKMLPDAIRGRKTLDSSSKGGRAKAKQDREIAGSLQNEANKIWQQDPDLPKIEIAKRLTKEINRLIDLAKKDEWEDDNPLDEIAEKLGLAERRPNIDTIRRIIKNPFKNSLSKS